MRNYQLISLLIITAGVAFIAGVRLGERRVAVGSPVAVGSCDCGAPARPPANAATAKPPTIPTGSGRPCLVELGSDECNECQRMRQVLAELTPKLRGQVDIVKVDTDVHRGQAQHWRLRMVPTQILVDARGRELWRHEGYFASGPLLAKVKGSAGRAMRASAPRGRATHD